MRQPTTSVLIVDSPPACDELAARLKAAGLVTAQASDPSRVDSYLRNLLFDLVVVDLDGDPEAALRLLQDVGRRQPRAVRVATTSGGAHGFGFPILRKPFGLEALLSQAA